MDYLKSPLAFILILLKITYSLAKTPRFEIICDQTHITIQDLLTVTITISVPGDKIEDLKFPDFSDFVIVGRNQSTSRSFTFDFRSLPVSYITHTYIYTLKPKKTGVLKIGSGSFRFKGDIYRSNSISITVSPSSGQKSSPLPSPQDIFPSFPSITPPRDISAKEIFVEMVPSKNSLYVGEQMTLTVYIWTKVDISDIAVVREPGTDGFWIEDLIGAQRRLEFFRREIKGDIFEVAVLRRYALFPIKAGSLIISPIKVDIEAIIDDGFFGTRKIISRSSNSVKVQAIPLPKKKKPKGFEAMNVGEYTIKAEISSPRIEVGLPFTLNVIISGKGNIRNIKLGPLPNISSFKVYQPKIKDEVFTHHGTITGKKTYEFLLLAKQPGIFKIPEIRFSFFNPKQGYKTISSAPIKIEVFGIQRAKRIKKKTKPKPSRTSKIYPIRPKVNFNFSNRAFYHSLAFYLLLGFFPLVYFSLLIVKHIQNYKKSTRELLASKNAAKVAKKKLKLAKRFIDSQEFYQRLSKILKEFLEERHKVRIGSMTNIELENFLKSCGYSENLARTFIKELERYDMARFGQNSSLKYPAKKALLQLEYIISEMNKIPLSVSQTKKIEDIKRKELG
jgi:hypothetical protein